jgi:hypothetical protein
MILAVIPDRLDQAAASHAMAAPQKKSRRIVGCGGFLLLAR